MQELPKSPFDEVAFLCAAGYWVVAVTGADIYSSIQGKKCFCRMFTDIYSVITQKCPLFSLDFGK